MIYLTMLFVYIVGFATGLAVKELFDKHEEHMALTRNNLAILETRRNIAKDIEEQQEQRTKKTAPPRYDY